MKWFGRPIHVILIHLPAVLFPLELVSYFIYYKIEAASVSTISLYALTGGVLFGWLAVMTGAIDMVMIKDQGDLQVKALLHGFVNTIVVLGYTILWLALYTRHSYITAASLPLLVMRFLLMLLLITGNYLGRKLR